MRCQLMHKDVAVADVQLDDVTGQIGDPVDVRNRDHLPVGTVVEGEPREDRLKRWWAGRSIPMSRSGLRHLLEALDIDTAGMLLSRSMCLSLSDHYWMCPDGRDVAWADINFFDNAFSEDVGDLLFGKEVRVGSMDLSSPDNTSDGVLRKRWKIVDGRRCLIKSGTMPIMQEPYNEVVASWVARSMGLPAVEYDVVDVDGSPCSICGDFVTAGTELVPAHQVMRSEIHDPSVNGYDHYAGCCQHHGIDVTPFMDRLLTLDYIIANEDRHTGNFGVLRDPDSLEWIGPAPVYDSGASMGYNLLNGTILERAGESCKPFSEHFGIQMGMVRDLSWFDPDPVLAAIDRAEAFLAGVPAMGGGRSEEISGLLRSRTEDVAVYAERRRGSRSHHGHETLEREARPQGHVASVGHGYSECDHLVASLHALECLDHRRLRDAVPAARDGERPFATALDPVGCGECLRVRFGSLLDHRGLRLP